MEVPLMGSVRVQNIIIIKLTGSGQVIFSYLDFSFMH